MNNIFNKMAAEMFPKNAESFQNGGTDMYQEWQFSTVYKLIFWRHTFSSRTHHQNTRPTINRRNLPIMSNIPDFISLFFTKNSSILPKCFQNFFCVFGLIQNIRFTYFYLMGVVHVFFYKQFFYSFVSGCTIKFDYYYGTGIIDVCYLFAILRLPKY